MGRENQMKIIQSNTIFLEISKLLEKAINNTFDQVNMSQSEIYKLITDAPNFKMGHFAFPCFPLAKICKMAPPQIAGKIIEQLENSSIVKEAKAVGPYINFFINPNGLGENVLEKIINGQFFKIKLIEAPLKTMIEYSQPNTHKEMHVGHMRNLCLGNALVELHKYTGHEIRPVTYPGDMGTHVAKCLWYLKTKYKGEIPSENKGAWLGKMYSEGNILLEDELGGPNEEQNRKELTDILKQLEKGEGEYFDLWKETKQWSIDLMNEAYSWADVKFDRWFFESEVDTESLNLAKKLYADGVLVESEGAIGMDLKNENLGFCLLIKSDGNGLYATKDVELARRKFEEFGIEKSIYVVDNRQTLHFKQVFKVLEKIGFEQVNNCYHLPYEMVELTDGAMSSRKGNVVPLMDLIKQMESTITQNYLEKYRGDWSDEEIKEVARIVANGAIKYGMIRVDNNRKIVFEMGEWLKLDGETGPYLQYVCARINSLLKKQDYNINDKINWSSLIKDEELALMIKISKFNDICVNACEGHKTNLLTSYLYELGKLFNSFYAECSIANAESDEIKKARMALSNSTYKIMKQGLANLGIPTPERM